MSRAVAQPTGVAPEAPAAMAGAKLLPEAGEAAAAGNHPTTDAPAAASNAKALAREIRAAKRLTPALKRNWLALLPHLHDDDRRRLAAILRGDAQ